MHTPRPLWLWIIVGLLAGSVLASLGLVAVAVLYQDNLVTDHYYEAGKGISRSLERERLAQQLGLRGRLQLDNVNGQAQLQLEGGSHPATLALNLISPTRADQDRHVTLQRVADDLYAGALPEPIRGRRFVEVLGNEQHQPWRLFEEETLEEGQPVVLGDEALSGVEHRAP